VFIGPDVTFSNDPRPRSGRHLESHPRTRVREGASLGAGTILLPGITVGRYAMVGAGALLTRDVPDFALVYGSPAQVHGHVCRCAATLRFENGSSATACSCGCRYARDAAGAVSEIE
jgi:acetyltransferase-like isoleucine patch superfamily enzyme